MGIELKAIGDLKDMKFFIPSYQRGYRWTKRQVKDLLNDIQEFIESKAGWYCLQPLVVKKCDSDCYEVIDGQQRLTTIFIILTVLAEATRYTLAYATRKEFQNFLNNCIYKRLDSTTDLKERRETLIEENETFDNIDFFHVFTTFYIVNSWFEKSDNNKESFKQKLLENVRFIWYELQDEDSIKVFRRLNVGKIPLTNAELIKALFLNKSNFPEQSEQLRQRQMEIAMEWDQIEYTLQNDEFWSFIYRENWKISTRIDLLFNLIVEKNDFNLDFKNDFDFKIEETDDYHTFRYFYKYFKDKENKMDSAKKCWSKVKEYFQIFQEWFNDLRMYHYVGFLVEQRVSLKDIIEDWKGDKKEFVGKLEEKIKEKIKKHADLSEIYEVEYTDKDGNQKTGQPKTHCKPILLLHNIQTVINQNSQFQSKEEYKLPVFYKFPFHLFKNETWNVEHINSNTTNGLEKDIEQKEWLKYSLLKEDLTDDIKNKIKAFLNNSGENPSFEELSNEIETADDGEWDNIDKNKIWNFVLLDEGTNKGYGNAIFPAKRRCIIGKDQGKKYTISDALEVSEEKGSIAFVPPVTKHVFLKYYNTSVDNLQKWTKTDAEAYKKNILETLERFGVIESSNNQNGGNNE